MEHREPREYNKAAWGPGPWDAEPDRVEFEHAGLPCLLLRGPAGAWCGYAAVPPGHPWHGKDEEHVGASAHGGLTYASACAGDICHVPKPGEPDNVWWFGFDCAHAGDYIPCMGTRHAPRFGLDELTRPVLEGFDRANVYDHEAALRAVREGAWHFADVYRDLRYVRAETEALAELLADAGRR